MSDIAELVRTLTESVKVRDEADQKIEHAFNELEKVCKPLYEGATKLHNNDTGEHFNVTIQSVSYCEGGKMGFHVQLHRKSNKEEMFEDILGNQEIPNYTKTFVNSLNDEFKKKDIPFEVGTITVPSYYFVK